MNEIDNSPCVYSVVKIEPVSKVERKKWVANSNLKKLNMEFTSALAQ